ncbi:MAG: DUF4038 domain-containing protein [Clostridiaceae bacterium]|nr:DUF4038 domain-containing protein [Clostridiaceae bacterium]
MTVNNTRTTHTWDAIELSFTSAKKYEKPYIDVDFSVTFISPSGKQYKVPAYWDGDNTWKVRFAPPMPGHWFWESSSAYSDNTGFFDKKGEFEVEDYEGPNAVLNHGFLKVNSNGRGFVHHDETPFFWLGDTVWSATAKSNIDEWKEYIKYRSSQGFNMVQINSLPQYDASGEEARAPFLMNTEGEWDLNSINPEYFKYLDELMTITKEAGMYTAMVVVWYTYIEKIYEPDEKPSKKARFNNETVYHFARYLAARYASFGTIWLISGDSNYNEVKEDISVYKTAAKTISEFTPHSLLATAHLSGNMTTPEVLNKEEWLNFHMYQSGHTIDGLNVTKKYAEKNRSLRPIRPVLNGEPCYEKIGYIEVKDRVEQKDVRDVAWTSILAGGNAGITYGAHGLWTWHRKGEEFPYQSSWMSLYEWKEALKFNGANDVARMKEFFIKIPWWELEPRRDLIDSTQIGDVTAASIGDDEIIIIYALNVTKIKLNLRNNNNYKLYWFNTLTSEESEFTYTRNGELLTFDIPSDIEGAVFVLKKNV